MTHWRVESFMLPVIQQALGMARDCTWKFIKLQVSG